MNRPPSRLNHVMRRPLTWLLLAYLLLAGLYSVTTPLFEASDEVWHYAMVRYMAQNSLALPVQQPGVETAWRQEGSQPPLYYMLAALLTSWIDTGDVEAVRRINPHADIGVIVPDGNANMTIHDPAARAFPWRGTTLAVHLARLFSVALGAVTVTMTYRLGCALGKESAGKGTAGKQGSGEATPAGEEPGEGAAGAVNWLALAAAAFTAFNPMFLFISGSVNNDNLSTALASTLLVLIVELLQRRDRPSRRELVLIGLLAGAGMLAKFNIGFLLPLIGLALALLAYRLRSLRFFVVSSLVAGGLTVLVAGWWYVRNLQLYGDPTGLNVFIQIVGPRPIPANGAQLWSERHTFLMSYWGFFGGLNVALPDVVYAICNALGLLAVVGLGVAACLTLARLLRRQTPADGGRRAWPVLAGRAVSLLWIVVLFGGLLRWTSETWASQGRLMFAAIAPISLWLVSGLWQVGRLLALPLPRGRWLSAVPLLPPAVAIVWLAGLALYAPVVIGRAYAAPEPVARSARGIEVIPARGGVPPLILPVVSSAEFLEPGQSASALIVEQLESGRVVQAPLHVGEYYVVRPALRLGSQPFTRDWSFFLHLETPDGLIVAQRDVYPGQGAWATTVLNGVDRDLTWFNGLAVRVPDHAVAPQRLNVYLGLYDLRTGERMLARGDGAGADNRVLLGTVELLPREALPGLDYPNPMRVNFGDEAELLGYRVAPASMNLPPGSTVEVTLYWRRRRAISADYRVFVQIIQPNTTRVFGQNDAMPAGWSRPTSTWADGEVIEDRHTFTVNADAELGIWQLIVGMYALRETPAPDSSAAPTVRFQLLRIFTPDGGQADDFLALTRVRIHTP